MSACRQSRATNDFENGVTQLAKQGGLVPLPQRVVAAVGKPDTIGDEDVIVDVGLESGPKRLHGHDNPRSGFLTLVSSVSVASDLGGGPAGEDSVDDPAYLAVEPGVELKAFAQTHLLGKRDHQLAVVDFRLLLGQGVGQDLGAAVDTGRATLVLQENGTATCSWQSGQCRSDSP